MLRLVLLAAWCVCAGLAADDIASAVEDPQLLANYINTHQQVDFDAFQKALGIRNTEIFLPSCDGGACHAELIRIPGLKPEQTILWASHKASDFAFWLRYRKDTAGGWRFLTATPVNVKYFHPDHRLALVFGRPFFIVEEQGLAGTGLSTRVETWFDLRLLRAKPVIAYTKEGDRAPGCDACFLHVVNATATALRKGNVEQIRIKRNAHFETQDGDDSGKPQNLGDGVSIATLVRQPTGNFAPAPSSSRLPKNVLDSVFDIQDDDALSNEAFLKFDIAQLRRIASSPRSPEALWLGKFLKSCTDSPEKNELLKLLQ